MTIETRTRESRDSLQKFEQGLNDSQINILVFNGYKDLICSLAKPECPILFSKEFMDEYGISSDESVSIVHGKDFNPTLFGFKEFSAPQCTDYLLYVFPTKNRTKSYKIIECTHV
jgi:hypothetical protein